MVDIIPYILMEFVSKAKSHRNIDSWSLGRIVLRDMDDEMKENSFIRTLFDNDVAVESQRVVTVRHTERDAWDWLGGNVSQVLEDLFDSVIVG